METATKTAILPEKIPDEALIKILIMDNRLHKVEIGKLKSYIQELEHEIFNLTPQEKTKIHTEVQYQRQQKMIRDLESRIAKLKKDKEELIIKVAKQNNYVNIH